jgi:hypothetical protein
VAVLLLVRLRMRHAAWGLGRIALGSLGRWPAGPVPGLRFAKALGSGHDGGFGLRPSASVQGLFAVFDGEAAARAFAESSPTRAAYEDRAQETCVAVLRATSCRGTWSHDAIAVTATPANAGPVASLTRASIRARRAASFWRREPAAQAALAAAGGCRLAVGLGEAPLLRQATFSLWDSAADMDAYARSGAHQAAIHAAYGQGFFSESMFVRFAVLSLTGTWKGRRHG